MSDNELADVDRPGWLQPMAMAARDIRAGMLVVRHREGEPLPAQLVLRLVNTDDGDVTFHGGPVAFTVALDDVLQVLAEYVRQDALGPDDVVRVAAGWSLWRDVPRVANLSLTWLRAYVDSPAVARAEEESRARLAEQARRRPYEVAAAAATPADAIAAWIAGHGVWAGAGVRTAVVRAFAEEAAGWLTRPAGDRLDSVRREIVLDLTRHAGTQMYFDTDY